MQLTAKLNKRERKAKQLLEHYQTCERLAHYVLKGTNLQPMEDGKRISVALWKAEQKAHAAAECYCNGEIGPTAWGTIGADVMGQVQRILGKLPPGFFVNGDPRGYALKIDNETPDGAALIKACQLHTDIGGFGILSPEIDGN